MDLTFLPHLSERALREEAERRGISIEGLDRAQLIAAIRGHEARAATVPPATPLAYAPTVPPEAPRPLEAARALIGRVVSLAKAALRSEPPPPPPTAEPDEPIRTRSMARVLEEQGHLERALSIVRELCAESPGDAELRVWQAGLEERIREQAIKKLARARLARDDAPFVEVLPGSESARGVAWRVSDAGIARAKALLGSDGALTLRVIRVRAHDDRSVESRQEDRRPLETVGWARIDAPASAKLVVSVGLWNGERFASIAHGAG